MITRQQKKSAKTMKLNTLVFFLGCNGSLSEYNRPNNFNKTIITSILKFALYLKKSSKK